MLRIQNQRKEEKDLPNRKRFSKYYSLTLNPISLFQQESKPKRLCIALDIDNTVASILEQDIGLEKEEITEKEALGQTCEIKKHIQQLKHTYSERIISLIIENWDRRLHLRHTYILHNGVLELLRYIIEAGHYLAFFSHGNARRNKALIKKIREKIFTREEDKNSNIVILSQQHCDHPYKKHPIKDLQQIVRYYADLNISISLDQIVLIDDTADYVKSDQIKNLINVPGCDYSLNDFEHKPLNLFLKYNQIFHVAAILDHISKQSKPLLALDLFCSDSESSSLTKQMFYDRGLNILKRFNPSLEFIIYHTFTEYDQPSKTLTP